MTQLNQFCTDFGIDPVAAKKALEHAGAANDHDQPWYVQLMLAIGSWVTALLLIAFCGFFISLVLDLDGASFGPVLAVAGLIFFTAAFAMLRRHEAGVFSTHFATALAAAGQGMVAVGIGIYVEEPWAAALASAPFAILIASTIDNRMLQGLSSTWVVVLVFIALFEQEFPFILEIAALSVAAGVFLHLYPPRRDLAPTAGVLLLVSPLLSIMFDFQGKLEFSTVASSGWIAQLIFVALIVFLLHALWRHAGDRSGQIELAIFAAAAIAVAVILPPGAGAALVILVLAFSLGARVLAIMGVVLEIYFLWKFYYDLNMTLLHKSFMLAGVGVVVLALWGVLARVLHKEPAS